MSDLATQCAFCSPYQKADKELTRVGEGVWRQSDPNIEAFLVSFS